jgi:hypothetical protein
MYRLLFGLLAANGALAVSLLWWRCQWDPSAEFIVSFVQYAFLVLIS